MGIPLLLAGIGRDLDVDARCCLELVLEPYEVLTGALSLCLEGGFRAWTDL